MVNPAGGIPAGCARPVGVVCGESYPCPPGRGLARYAAAGLFIADRLSKRDNALIGYCRAGLGDQPLEGAERRNQISFEVRGFPPAKSEALSMLGAGHSHAPRVRRLLEAAQQAREKQAFTPIESRRVALDVIVRAPAGQNPADATNYLGGIADVLEEKSHRGVLDHLGYRVGLALP